MPTSEEWLRRINAGEKITNEPMPPAWRSCYTCRDYLEHRQFVLIQPLAAKADREDRDPVEVVDEYMAAAHARHLAGQPLREGGPTRVTDPTLGRLAALLSPGLFGPPREAT